MLQMVMVPAVVVHHEIDHLRQHYESPFFVVVIVNAIVLSNSNSALSLSLSLPIVLLLPSFEKAATGIVKCYVIRQPVLSESKESVFDVIDDLFCLAKRGLLVACCAACCCWWWWGVLSMRSLQFAKPFSGDFPVTFGFSSDFSVTFDPGHRKVTGKS